MKRSCFAGGLSLLLFLAAPACSRPTSTRAGAALDSAAVAERLYLSIEGMHCAGCTQVITEELVALDGVVAAEVTLETGRAVVGLSSDPASVELILATIYDLGYEAQPLEPPPTPQ